MVEKVDMMLGARDPLEGNGNGREEEEAVGDRGL